MRKRASPAAPCVAEMETNGLGSTDESMIFNNDHSKGDDVDSAEREAGDGGDGSGCHSDCSTADGQFKESDTPDTQWTSIASSGFE